MNYDVLIYTRDDIFGRMLELEFSFLGLQAACVAAWKKELFGKIVLLDLDDGELPPAGSYESMIGYTRNSALHSVDLGRKCSMILHRPFEVSLLRREVLLLLKEAPSVDRSAVTSASNVMATRLYLHPEKHTLCYGEKQISLSPKELVLIDCLLARGEGFVPKSQLESLLGGGDSNILQVYICFLRKKLEALGVPQRIKTVRGKGYRIV